MKDSIVRLSDISIRNLKNVEEGRLNFNNRRKNYKASILGLYGQNGSGKTALIDAMELLKLALCGKKVPAAYADYIQVDTEYAALEYVFDVSVPGGKYKAYYEFCLRREQDTSSQNMDTDDSHEEQTKAVIFDECLSYSYDGEDAKIRKGPFIDTRTDKAFVPVTRYENLFGKDKQIEAELLISKKIAETSSRSFIFSREMLNAVRKQSRADSDKEFKRNLELLENLIYYGNYELFVISVAEGGIISMNALPLAFKYEEGNKGTIGSMMLRLDAPAVIPQKAFGVVQKVIRDMNVVLSEIVPGLTIDVKDLGIQTMKNGKLGSRIQLMSRKNSKEIPLRYESQGIKKIISVLQLLIVIYNQSSITVAIDELDAGVFEYLLGEILRIISNKGKGQLIFTSHNLRPLETLDRGFIAFTTTNPHKRYVRMTNIKDNNNLRDFYYRDIVLGEQNEELYEPTNNADIALALVAAGVIDDA